MCAAGQFWVKEDSPCKNCEAGRYQELTGKSVCKACGKGKFRNEKNGNEGVGADQPEKLACVKCASGQYQGETARSSCDKCPAGRKGQALPAGVDQGFFDANSACEDCPSGRYQDQQGAPSCKNEGCVDSMCWFTREGVPIIPRKMSQTDAMMIMQWDAMTNTKHKNDNLNPAKWQDPTYEMQVCWKQETEKLADGVNCNETDWRDFCNTDQQNKDHCQNMPNTLSLKLIQKFGIFLRVSQVNEFSTEMLHPTFSSTTGCERTYRLQATLCRRSRS